MIVHRPARATGRHDVALTDAELAACASEPIHRPGAVQAHGCLLILSPELTIVRASRNCERHLGRAPATLLNRPIENAVGVDNARAIRRAIERGGLESRPLFAGRLSLATGRFGDAVVHTYGGRVFVEIETLSVGEAPTFFEMYPIVRRLTSSFPRAADIPGLCGLIVDEMRLLTGFGRVMAYRFDAEGHGEVLAESAGDTTLPSYLGQRFPAGDIPPQARALYRANHVRLIPDVDYVPSSIEPAEIGEADDLSFTALRSVSPVHLQYMRNMGTASSMSVSIIVRGALWGLVSCHDERPKHVPFEVRTICEHLGQILSLQVEAREEYAETAHRLELRRQLVRMLAQMAEERRGFVQGLLVHPDALLGFMQASGAAIIENGACHRVGTTPTESSLRALALWLAQDRETIFRTSEARKDVPPHVALGDDTGGFIAVSISQLHGHYVIWFRPEVAKVVRWAGQPTPGAPSVVVGQRRLPGPRNSFEEWREIVRGQCEPWRPSEVDIASEFRAAILAIVMRSAEETAALAAELRRTNHELEAFSYSVSHDLRAPLRHIVGYADLLRETEGERLSERSLRFLGNIGDAAVHAGLLVDNLLSFSQMGRAALKIAPVELDEIVQVVVAELRRENAGRKIEWRVASLPRIEADPAFLLPAMRNLIGNAVKYSRGRSPAIVEVSAESGPDETIVHVRDNGVGFNMKYVGKLFGIFQRLHRTEDFEGTGIGLANVKRIIERHGGRVWAEGEPDKGAVFSFALPGRSAERPVSE